MNICVGLCIVYERSVQIVQAAKELFMYEYVWYVCATLFHKYKYKYKRANSLVELYFLILLTE